MNRQNQKKRYINDIVGKKLQLILVFKKKVSQNIIFNYLVKFLLLFSIFIFIVTKFPKNMKKYTKFSFIYK